MNSGQPSPKSETKIFVSPYVLAAALIIVVLATAFLIPKYFGEDRGTPSYALTQIRQIKTDSDVRTHNAYLTEQGERIVKLVLSDANRSEFRPDFGDPEVSGDSCSVAFQDPKTEGELRFRKKDVWQLDNVLLSKVNGHSFHADLSTIVGPAEALVEAIKDKTPTDVRADNLHLTEKGKEVFLKLLEVNQGQGSPRNHATCGDPIIDTNLVQFPFFTEDGQIEGRYLVVYDGRWKVDDLFVVKVNGETINSRVSDKIEHPVLSWFKQLFQ